MPHTVEYGPFLAPQRLLGTAFGPLDICGEILMAYEVRIIRR